MPLHLLSTALTRPRSLNLSSQHTYVVYTLDHPGSPPLDPLEFTYIPLELGQPQTRYIIPSATF